MSEPNIVHAKAEPIIALIETWFFEAFHGSPIARSTEIWNVAHEAKEDLKRRLAILFETPPVA